MQEKRTIIHKKINIYLLYYSVGIYLTIVVLASTLINWRSLPSAMRRSFS